MPAATDLAFAYEVTGPCRSSGTARTALALTVRSELPMNRIMPPSSATAAASTTTRVSGLARRAAEASPGEWHVCPHAWSTTLRPSTSVTIRSARAATSTSWVAVTSAKPNRSCSASIEVEHALAGVGVEVAGGLVAEQQVGALAERARDGHALLLAARQLGRQRVELRAEADERRAAPRGRRRRRKRPARTRRSRRR